ncbi:hypothetical protein ElyMa_006069700 [Elysia marginata]|uniref:Uncharacterized protein n=1 Tax=Elysia marginata TaxID=1093978 RepID=A0AAV4GPI5_9GAST|nr:hypothetical protein ElyMa_006069700 [Elysia marginata]
MSVDDQAEKERKGASTDCKRNNTLVFTLKGAGGRMRVCKEIFLKTTGLTKWWVLNTFKEKEEGPKNTEQRTDSDAKKFVKEFLDRLPKMPSPYCRKDTQKLYLEPLFQSRADVYREYTRLCDV